MKVKLDCCVHGQQNHVSDGTDQEGLMARKQTLTNVIFALCFEMYGSSSVRIREGTALGIRD